MKITQPITVAGHYRQADGRWQSAQVVTDGVTVVEILSFEVSDEPSTFPADLIGVEAAVGQPFDSTLENFGAGSIVTDFRSSDIAMGGQGAPLHPFYLHALAKAQHTKPVVYLLIEDAVSLVWVDPSVQDPTEPKAITAFETGPGLGPVNQLPHSKLKGEVVDGALELFLDDPYFRRLPPKQVDPSSFTHLLTLVNELAPEDALATLLGMSATSVLLGLEHLPSVPAKFVLAGDGANNALLQDLLSAALDAPIETFGDHDTVQAQSIAFLAARVAQGLPTTAPHTTGVAAAVGGGTVSKTP